MSAGLLKPGNRVWVPNPFPATADEPKTPGFGECVQPHRLNAAVPI